jgi:RNA polymerase sigma-70 factor, ECF subfamily
VKSNGEVKPIEPLPDEKRLVEQAKSGDTEAFGQVYDACVDRVYRFIFFRVSDVPTAEDLTSQVFLKAWRNLGRYRPNGPILAWLYTIARNTVIDHYRTFKQTVPLEEAAPVAVQNDSLDEMVEFGFEMEALQKSLQTLTDEQREVIILKFIAEFDTDQIARKMGKSEGAVRALQMRALQSLAKVMKKEDKEEVWTTLNGH